MFLASMVLIGWVAINEPGRMEAFSEQHLARSVEKGAELFANNCAECHGPQGLGSGRAPALNNPHLFGIDFFAGIDADIASLEAAQQNITHIQAVLSGEAEAGDDEDTDEHSRDSRGLGPAARNHLRRYEIAGNPRENKVAQLGRPAQVL